MVSGVTSNGVPIGAVAARMDSPARPALAAAPEPSTTAPDISGTAKAADVSCPEAAMLCAALALAWPLA